MRVYVNDPETDQPVERELVGDEMPCQIGVYCDNCRDIFEGNYIVRESMTSGERHEAARAHLRMRGWRCDEQGDFCPTCKADIEAYR